MYETFVILSGVIGAEILAQVVLQKYVDKDGLIFLILGMLLLALVAYFYSMLLALGHALSYATAFRTLGAQIGVTLVGYFFYKQVLNLKQTVGLMLIIVGTYLLSLEGK